MSRSEKKVDETEEAKRDDKETREVSEYFVGEPYNVPVKATSHQEAIEIAKKLTNESKEDK